MLITRKSSIARISYGNSVHLSIHLSVTTRYRFKTRLDRDFGFSPHDSLESLVFRDKISCRWIKGIPRTRRQKGGTLSKKRYSTAIAFTRRRHTTRYAMADVYIYMAVNKMLNLIDFKHLQTVLLSVVYARIKTFFSIADKVLRQQNYKC